MGTLGTLAVSIVGDASGLNKTLDTTQSKFQNTGKKIGAAGGTLTRNVTVPIMAAVGGAAALANKYAGMGDDIAKTSTKLGVSTDALQEMHYWASQNGMEASTMERAVGRLNQRIGRAATGNAKYTEAFEALGISIHDANGDIRDTETVMQDAVAALREVEDPAMRSAMASEIFGTKMARDLMPALEDSSLSLEDAAAKIHELGGVMSEDAVRAAEDYQDSMDDLKREFGGLWMELANKFIPIIVDDLLPAIKDHVIPAIKNFTEWIGKLIDWFMDLDPIWQKVIGAVVAFAAVLGPILIIVGKVVMAIGAILPVLKAVGAAILLLTSPIGIIVAAVVGLAYLIYRYWDEIKEFTIKAWGAIKDFFIGLWDTVTEAFSKTWDFIKELFSYSPLGLIIDNWDGIKDYFHNLWGGIKDFLSDTWGSILGIFSGGSEESESVIKERFGAIWDFIKDIWERIVEFYKNIWGAITAIFRGDIDEAKDYLEDAYGDTFRFISNIWGKISDFFSNIWATIFNTYRDRLTSIWDTISYWFNRARDFIFGVWGRIGDFIRGALRDILINLRASFEVMVSRARSSAEDIYNTVIHWIGSLPGRLLQIGRDMIANLVQGIRDRIGSVTGAVRDVVSAVTGATTRGAVKSTTAAVKNTVKGVTDTVRDAVGGVADLLPMSPAKEGPLKKEPDFTGYLVGGLKGADREVKRAMEKTIGIIPPEVSVSATKGLQRVEHRGTIRLEGVSSEGQLVGVKEIIIDELRREIRG